MITINQKIYLYFFSFSIFFLACQTPKEAIGPSQNIKGQLRHIENFQSEYVTARNVDVWMPENYEESRKYSVLYMHDGQMLFDSTTTWNKQEWGIDEALDTLIKSGELPPMIVVGIWNAGAERHSDYFPEKAFDLIPKSFLDSLQNLHSPGSDTTLFPFNVQSDNYLKFIVEELKPFIDSSFSTLKNFENTFIAGSSMGGLISMYAFCEYPDIFGGAACLSTHWIGTMEKENNPIPYSFMAYLSENLPEPGNRKIYFDYGTKTLDSLYEVFQLQVDRIMIEKGYDSDNWTTKKFEGENHSERSWKKRLDIPLKFITKTD